MTLTQIAYRYHLFHTAGLARWYAALRAIGVQGF
jgi:hypothetical protein